MPPAQDGIGHGMAENGRGWHRSCRPEDARSNGWQGLCNHKGLEPLYPIYQHALINGTPDAREYAAKGSLDSKHFYFASLILDLT